MKVCGALVPPRVVTVTPTGPRACAGVVNVSEVPSPAMLSGVIGAEPSTETVESARKPEPATVTVVPPPTGPCAGVRPVIAGTGT